jgi:hypothetical protein
MGWQNITFNQIIVQGNNAGVFIYNGAPGPGTLIGSIAAQPGTDVFGNAYSAGISFGESSTPQVMIGPIPSGSGSEISFPTNTADQGIVGAVLSQVINSGLANQYLQMLIQGPSNSADTIPQDFQIILNSDSDDFTVNASMQIVDSNGNPYLTFQQLANGPTLYIGETPSTNQTFVNGVMNAVLAGYSSSGGGTVIKTFSSTGTMVFPAGVSTARVQNWGSAAGGQWASGPGGGSGEYAEEPSLSVTAGLTYTATVPGGGAAGTSSNGGTGRAGANAVFSQAATTLVTAHGAPANASNPSTGGTGSSATIHHNGAGCTCVSTGPAKGGGGGAGSPSPTAAGNAGGSNFGSAGNGYGSAGTGPYKYGGNGGWGGNQVQDTSAGSPGGIAAGGGSGGATATAGQPGGAGGRAQIIVTYSVPNSAGIVASFSSTAGTDSAGNTFPAGFQGPSVAVQPGSSPSAFETWHNVTNPGGWSGLQRYKLCAENNMVYLDMTLTHAAFATKGASTLMFTLSTGYRPTRSITLPLTCTNNSALAAPTPACFIATNGNVTFFNIDAGTTGTDVHSQFPID